jgi:broad specificity phosphatase PhoE
MSLRNESDPKSRAAPVGCLVRHGRILDYRTDQPLTAQGRREARDVGRAMANDIRGVERVRFYSGPSRRTRETAALLRDGLRSVVAEKDLHIDVFPVVAVEDRLQNFQFYLNGLSYDPIEPLMDVSRWRSMENPSRHHKACVAFHTAFWRSADPMGYWLTHPSEAVESPQSVAERTYACVTHHLNEAVRASERRRDICVTHSANLRAFLQRVFGDVPGEPPFCGIVLISAGLVHWEGQVTPFPMSGG